jgi:uncharacterized SAM-binding protein YcdF (DUF218 family)
VLGIGVCVFGHGAFLRAAGQLLVIDDPVEPAMAIVVLAGGFPVREIEAADLYRAGFAPRIILVPELQNREAELRALGLPTTSDLRRNLLTRLGVPPDAVVVLQDPATTTVDELQIAARATDRQGPPVILVTSRFHTRRVGLTWAYLNGGQPRAIVRGARTDPFDPAGWWHDPGSVRAVLHELAGLIDLGLRWLLSERPDRARGPG